MHTQKKARSLDKEEVRVCVGVLTEDIKESVEWTRLLIKMMHQKISWLVMFRGKGEEEAGNRAP